MVRLSVIILAIQAGLSDTIKLTDRRTDTDITDIQVSHTRTVIRAKPAGVVQRTGETGRASLL